MACIIFAVAFFAVSTANAVSAYSSFPQPYDSPSASNSERIDILHQHVMPAARVGGIIEGHNLTWGESIGWVNLKEKQADLKIGSDILTGWIWLENCGWVCLGGGRPLDGGRYSNKSVHDWGVNNDGQGNLSGYAWSEVTGWISFQTSHSRVYLGETGQFYGYAWGENVGWMHFGPGRSVRYLAKADPGPWKGIAPGAGNRFAGDSSGSELCSDFGSGTGLNNIQERYSKNARIVCSLSLVRDDFCARIRCCDTPVYISGLAEISPIRAPPAIN
ncbi:MAG: hypothetical protein NTZ78_09200 [Candidatus Aureabacteria bacterium]|nr:hypothetical protein [Candidatus Auribacterota bacterium]